MTFTDLVELDKTSPKQARQKPQKRRLSPPGYPSTTFKGKSIKSSKTSPSVVSVNKRKSTTPLPHSKKTAPRHKRGGIPKVGDRQSTDQLTNQLTDQSIDLSSILGKPRGFYISKKQDEDLSIAVKKLSKRMKGRVDQKIDRSTVLRLLIESSNITSRETIEKLAKQLTNRLISQLTNG